MKLMVINLKNKSTNEKNLINEKLLSKKYIHIVCIYLIAPEYIKI